MPEVPDEVDFRVPPDWVCEIVDAQLAGPVDALGRGRDDPQAQVGFAWLVNPVARTLEVLRLEQGRWVLVDARAEGSGLRLEPFDAVDLDLALVWE
jgi:Uma2 family endonuclease